MKNTHWFVSITSTHVWEERGKMCITLSMCSTWLNLRPYRRSGLFAIAASAAHRWCRHVPGCVWAMFGVWLGVFRVCFTRVWGAIGVCSALFQECLGCFGGIFFLFQVCFGSVLGVSGLCSGRVWAMCGVCLGRVWGMLGVRLGCAWKKMCMVSWQFSDKIMQNHAPANKGWGSENLSLCLHSVSRWPRPRVGGGTNCFSSFPSPALGRIGTYA